MLTDRIAVLRGPVGIVAGVALLLAGMVLAVWTERSMVGYEVVLQQHGGEVIDLGSNPSPQDGLQGDMVRITGTPQVIEAPRDPDFNQQTDTPLLVRHVEMFQWHELRLGSSVNYELDWKGKPEDTSRFAQPNGHINPGPFPVTGKTFNAGRVQLGGYTLAPALVQALPGSEPVTPNVQALPANLAASFALHDNAFVTSAQPGDARLGDLRVSWTMVPLQEVTVLARVDGDHLDAVPNAADGKGYEVDVGDSSLLDMRPDMAAHPAMVWPRRLLAVLLAALGASLLWLQRTERFDPPAALGGGLLATGAFAAIPWLGSNATAATSWLVTALVGVALMLWRRRARLH